MDNPSVIRWALEYDRDSLADYCYLDDDDNLVGEYSKIFEQAMRMEGIFKTQGKHAAGVVIASDPLDEVCPMVKASRSEEKIAGMEMGDLEAIGCVKFDILGVNLLKKISETVEEINYELS
jgi:DNA polymerase-3 subunit alpha